MTNAAPQFISDEIGTNDDAISLILNGDRVVYAMTWEHTEGVLSQPCQWSMYVGHGGVAADLIKKYPKGTPFELKVGSVTQATGKIDANGADQPEGGATSVLIAGRDALAKLQDTFVKSNLSANVTTYPQLVWFALEQVGIAPKNSPIDPKILRVDNVANRMLKAGVPITAILPHRTVEQILEDAGLGGPNAGVVHTTPMAKMNETYHRFLRRYLDRAGLMLWAAADGSFVLGAPNGNQPPTYVLARNRDTVNQAANGISCSFRDDATHRHTEAIVYGRGGGNKIGRVKARGDFVDQELVDAGYGDQPIVFRDVNVHSPAEAAYFARRKLAEERRGGWKLEYTVPGLTLPYAGSSAGQGLSRAVLVPDTIVEVHDQELGLDGPYYIETVIRRRSPQTTTTIRLMRPDDLVFGGPDADSEA